MKLIAMLHRRAAVIAANPVQARSRQTVCDRTPFKKAWACSVFYARMSSTKLIGDDSPSLDPCGPARQFENDHLIINYLIAARVLMSSQFVTTVIVDPEMNQAT